MFACFKSNIKYENPQSKIEVGLHKITCRVKCNRRPDSSTRSSDRWTRNSVSLTQLDRWERIPWLEQKPADHLSYQQPHQDQYRRKRKNVQFKQYIFACFCIAWHWCGPTIEPLWLATLLIKVQIFIIRKKKKTKKRNASQMRRPRPIRKKRRRWFDTYF